MRVSYTQMLNIKMYKVEPYVISLMAPPFKMFLLFLYIFFWGTLSVEQFCEQHQLL